MGHSDAFTQWLERVHPELTVRPYQPAGPWGGPVVGWQVRLGRTRFVYRVPAESPEVLYIVLIERADDREGLHSPFADLVRLLRLIQTSGAGVTWIRGHVEPTRKRPQDALTRERILAFYQRYLTAVSTGFENGIEWFGGDLSTFSWTAEKRRVTTRGRRGPSPHGVSEDSPVLT
ncbi:MAG: hypothetical protein U1F61_18695 [Opitutaceae bacterium]